MCIRDRYQRRVHGNFKEPKYIQGTNNFGQKQRYIETRLSMSTRFLKPEVDQDNYISKKKIIEYVQKEMKKSDGQQLTDQQIDNILQINNIVVQDDKVYYPEFKEKIKNNIYQYGSSNLYQSIKIQQTSKK
eukprot:TRINITY_DN7693_c0_g1_i2.p3 TRINITY_DN7693_c0_g1~~TRINITY_DN7693_c0_g1_i2.p3  ORF type:complete len:131 (-),score=38.62 TRINITY_DN7693_c0_g1_i2:355-747(-)